MSERAVRFTRFGGPEVLEIQQVDAPRPGAGEIRVRVHYAGLNPVDWKIVKGGPARQLPDLPSGNGNDFAGVVDQTGEGVTGISVGDRVFGGRRFFAQADHLVTTADAVVVAPEGLSLDVAGTLDIAGRTAIAAVDAVVSAGDTVLVGGAAGGVGVIAVQLALRAGARVLGTASESTFDFLREYGAVPVAYGDGMVDRIRQAAPDGVDAVLDFSGNGTVAAGLELGVPPEKINTNVDRDAVEEFGVRNEGAHTMPDLSRLAALGEAIAAGEIRVPIAGVYPLEELREAYERLIDGHVHGKLVLQLV